MTNHDAMPRALGMLALALLLASGVAWLGFGYRRVGGILLVLNNATLIAWYLIKRSRVG
jgi:Flp pilus assembly protein TadB